ncbi:MAG: TVP38/TMEM64 family protein [Synechococcus sp. SB0668_bin_15]|nr:TVP38/TMEM64 family protein [Synechococcus sp. SB0668_bin_15]MXZ83384.1 TVP38/TMEM64 family protein [Synechococcus sp. SB0666_bin_14]MYA91017.1 TVP38/TMEM64 family protein [Synechococcus sp. SB0663_bin_10]MYC50248.1 TVP38/TMEM64 family protein [Synechococcus sp. SB0662_bin_14]MYG47083.1 TVP38/TMEM64 family protein [Synechococcus sp. SB0675_bin_6]MYJ59174.1 TVP38/TMEM64 family protein [Synechococcus sp. SB0672_bin_6]MYK90711.1 TVP38/TMEM64 family protein [Synechococcus sp. SB0669_bin_8]
MSSFIEPVETFLRELGPVGWIVFIALYALAVTFYVPGSVLTLLGGALFGPRLGVLAVLAGAFLGMAGNWFLTRRWLRPWAQRKLEQNPRLQKLEQVLSRDEGWKLVALLRLSPLFPFVLINLVCALTSNLRFLAYMAASATILPGTILYIYIGDTVRRGLTLEGGLEQGQFALRILGVAATFAVVWLVGRTASKVLKKQLSETDT